MDEREILDPARLRGVVDDLDFYIKLFHNQTQRIPNGGVVNKNIIDAQQCAKILKKHKGLLRCVNDSVYEDMCISEQMTSQKMDSSDSGDETDCVAPSCSDGKTFSAAATAVAVVADLGNVLHCIALYCISFHFISFHFIALYCIVCQYIVFHCIVFISIALQCVAIYDTLHCNTIHDITVHCNALHCMYCSLYCFTMHCIALCRIILYCIILYSCNVYMNTVHTIHQWIYK